MHLQIFKMDGWLVVGIHALTHRNGGSRDRMLVRLHGNNIVYHLVTRIVLGDVFHGRCLQFDGSTIGHFDCKPC